MRVADLLGVPPEHIGAFGNMRIVEHSGIGFDESYLDTLADIVFVGEIAHFVYRYRQACLNIACRDACKSITDRLALTLGLH